MNHCIHTCWILAECPALVTTFLRNGHSVWFLRIRFLSLNWLTRCSDTTHAQFVFDSWSTLMKSNKRQLLYSTWTGQLVFFPHKMTETFISLPGSRLHGRGINSEFKWLRFWFSRGEGVAIGSLKNCIGTSTSMIISFVTRPVLARCQCQRLQLSLPES